MILRAVYNFKLSWKSTIRKIELLFSEVEIQDEPEKMPLETKESIISIIFFLDRPDSECFFNIMH